jgi:dihydropteroate synthase
MSDSWQIRDKRIDLSERALVMGILNVTPDSFSDGGRFLDRAAATRHALEMIEAGADIIDVGGESTRPGAQPVSAADEIDRVLPVIEALRRGAPAVLISVDTSKGDVARAALEAGADIINDITGLRGDPGMAGLAAQTGAGVVLMHMQGTPRDMQDSPAYHDVVGELRDFFSLRLEAALKAGINADSIILDPGIGFGKTLEHNLEILRRVGELAVLGHPIAIGLSRKSFIGKILQSEDPGDRLWPTVALSSLAREHGVLVHRVHDVRECAQAIRMTEAILSAT